MPSSSSISAACLMGQMGGAALPEGAPPSGNEFGIPASCAWPRKDPRPGFGSPGVPFGFRSAGILGGAQREYNYSRISSRWQESRKITL
jgi:hypothetical protein